MSGDVMELLITILFWLHLTALALGGAAAFGIPAVGSRIPGAAAEARPLLFEAVHTLSNLGKVAMAVLIITGPLIVWLRFGGTGGLNHWFWVKMVLIVLMLVAIILAGRATDKAAAGDMAALPRANLAGAAASGCLVLVVLTAVLTFS